MQTRIDVPKWKETRLRKLLFTGALLIVTLCLSLAQAAPVFAATHVVAEFTDMSGLYKTITTGTYAQIFTTGPSEAHSNAVQLKLLGNQHDPPATVRVSITETTSGLPNDSVLCSGTFARTFITNLAGTRYHSEAGHHLPPIRSTPWSLRQTPVRVR